MSARSTINVKCKDGKVRQIYCHNYGHLSHQGVTLVKHHNSQAKAEAIVNLGDASYLDKSIEKPEGHSFENPIKGYSVFYGRDRQEKGVEAQVFESIEEAMQDGNTQGNEYYWNGKKWMHSRYGTMFIEITA